MERKQQSSSSNLKGYKKYSNDKYKKRKHHRLPMHSKYGKYDNEYDDEVSCKKCGSERIDEFLQVIFFNDFL